MARRLFILLLVAVIGCGQATTPSKGKGRGRPKPPPEHTPMAIIFCDGFEHAESGTGVDFNPFGFGAEYTTVRTGSVSRDCSDASSPILKDKHFGHTGLPAYFNVPSTFTSFYLRRTGNFTDGQDIVLLRHTSDSGGNEKIRLQTQSTDKLKVITATGTTNGSTVLATNQWYRIDLECNTGVSAFWELKIDGVSEISATEDLNANNMALIRFPVVANALMDDVVVRDDSIQSGDDFRVETLFPDGDGNYTSWSGNGYLDVDDKVADSNETTTDTQTNRETYTFGNIPALSADDTIEGIMLIVTCRKTSNAAVNGQLIERESSTDRDTVDFLVLKNDATSDTHRWLIQTTKPSGGAWTESAINGYEAGMEHNQSQARDIFMDRVAVNVLVSTTAAPAGASAGRMTLLGVQ